MHYFQNIKESGTTFYNIILNQNNKSFQVWNDFLVMTEIACDSMERQLCVEINSLGQRKRGDYDEKLLATLILNVLP